MHHCPGGGGELWPVVSIIVDAPTWASPGIKIFGLCWITFVRRYAILVPPTAHHCCHPLPWLQLGLRYFICIASHMWGGTPYWHPLLLMRSFQFIPRWYCTTYPGEAAQRVPQFPCIYCLMKFIVLPTGGACSCAPCPNTVTCSPPPLPFSRSTTTCSCRVCRTNGSCCCSLYKMSCWVCNCAFNVFNLCPRCCSILRICNVQGDFNFKYGWTCFYTGGRSWHSPYTMAATLPVSCSVAPSLWFIIVWICNKSGWVAH